MRRSFAVCGRPLVSPVASTEQLRHLQQSCRRGFVDPMLMQYAVRLVSATRDPARHGLEALAPRISFGASPRASIALVEAARALAFLRGRDYVFPQDLVDVAHDVLRHRVTLSYEAIADGVSADDLIDQILEVLAPPEKPLENHVRAG